MVHCPGHADRVPSLSIAIGDDGKTLLHCHAGCEQARVIAALRSRGLWRDSQYRACTGRPASVPYDARQERRTYAALAIWREAVPAAGTPVESYLAARGLHLPASPALRFHRQLRHPSGGSWPGMVALVTRAVDGKPVGIHRTFLAADGRRKAPVKPDRMMLGPCRGGAVCFAEPDSLLLVSEGLETGLSAIQAAGYAGWAALSTAGLRSLELPGNHREVVILADGDDSGEAAARFAAMRWRQEDRRVRIARPPRGLDFNDVLCGAASVCGGDT